MLKRRWDEVRARSRERDLASAHRAGSWSRRKARVAQRQFLGQHAWRVAAIALVALAFLGLAALVLEGERYWFGAGFFSATVIGLVTHWVVVYSGSANAVMGDVGEQWTNQVVRSLRRRGWKVIHRVLLGGEGDLDTVLIGPPGFVVLETKWSSENWSSPKQERWIAKAVNQVTEAARLLPTFTRGASGGERLPMHRVVVLWPADSNLRRHELAGVTVLNGPELRQWMSALPEAGVPPEQLNAVWKHLSDQLARRPDSDVAVPKSADDYFNDIVHLYLGVLASLGLLSWLGSALSWYLSWATAGLLAPALYPLTRLSQSRRFAIGALCGTLFVFGLLLGGLLIELVT